MLLLMRVFPLERDLRGLLVVQFKRALVFYEGNISTRLLLVTTLSQECSGMINVLGR